MNFSDIFRGLKGNFQYYSKMGFATEEVFIDRLNVCFHCEHIQNKDNMIKIKCNLCGCPLRKKLILKNSKCRKDKW